MKPVSIAAALAWATGAWASLGVVAVTSQTTTAARTGLLPPAWLLAALAVAAVAAVVALRLDRDQTAPLWLGLVAWLPWIPGPIPAAFLIFDGPVAGAVVALVAAIVIGRVAAGVTQPSWSPRSHLALAFVVAAAASGLAAWRLAPILPDGDEPHYLVITQSLLDDGDLQVENNYRRGDYTAYAERDLKPDYLRRGQNGQIYSIHAPGVAALVLPAFAAGGYRGAVVFLVLLFGLASALTWRAAFELTGDAPSAWVGWAGVALSTPAFFHSFTVYPDGPAALIVIGAVSFLIGAREKQGGKGGEGGEGGEGYVTAQWLLVGTTIAALPWLHTRLAMVAVPLLVVLAARSVRSDRVAPVGSGQGGAGQSGRIGSGGSIRSLAALLVVPVISAVLWLTFFYVVYGTIDPRAPYGNRRAESLAGIPLGVTGLLIDQQFGLLPNAPIYGLAFAGLATLWRTHRRLVLELAAIAIPYGLVVSANEMWWAGFSAPARFLVPVLLPLALPLAAWWHRHDSRVPRAFAVVGLGASLAITATLAWTGRGALLYNAHDGFALWLDRLAPAVSLARAEPTVFRGALAAAWSQAAIWIVAAMGCWWALQRMARLTASAEATASPSERFAPRRTPGPPYRLTPGVWILAAGVAISATLVLAVQLSWAVSSGPAVEEGASELRLLAAACEPHLPSAAGDRVSRLIVPDASRRSPAADRAIWSGHDVPPGRYDLRLTASAESTGTLTVALGRPDVVIATCDVKGAAPGTAACSVDLPAGAEALWVRADNRLRQTVTSVGLTLATPPSASTCDLRARRAVVAGAQVLYVTDGLVYAKRRGVWVLGGAEGRFVASGSGATLLRLQNGPARNHIAVTQGGWRDDWDAPPGAFHDERIPGAEPFTITATAGFDSGAVDPEIRGHRSLGVWVSFQDAGRQVTTVGGK